MRTIKHGNEYMALDDDGNVSRPEIGMSASGEWRIVGAVTLNNFGNVTRRFSLAEILTAPESISWQHKNGRQRTHVLDLDHGTQRMWGSPTHSIF